MDHDPAEYNFPPQGSVSKKIVAYMARIKCSMRPTLLQLSRDVDAALKNEPMFLTSRPEPILVHTRPESRRLGTHGRSLVALVPAIQVETLLSFSILLAQMRSAFQNFVESAVPRPTLERSPSEPHFRVRRLATSIRFPDSPHHDDAQPNSTRDPSTNVNIPFAKSKESGSIRALGFTTGISPKDSDSYTDQALDVILTAVDSLDSGAITPFARQITMKKQGKTWHCFCGVAPDLPNWILSVLS